MTKEKSVQAFNEDVDANQRYVYSQADRLSSVLASRRINSSIRDMVDFKGKRVLDLGCGDGVFSAELLTYGAKEVLGVDAADVAIKAAAKRHRADRRLTFKVLDVYKAGSLPKHWDVIVIRGLLHHLYDVNAAVAAISGLASTVVVVEPNGYNPVLKVIEKTSRYHIEHEERSYRPGRLDQWFEDNGYSVKRRAYIGLVPFFCPAPLTRALKLAEPVLESLPLVKQMACGQYVFMAQRA
jgi:SAM-dependent methyltransferase